MTPQVPNSFIPPHTNLHSIVNVNQVSLDPISLTLEKMPPTRKSHFWIGASRSGKCDPKIIENQAKFRQRCWLSKVIHSLKYGRHIKFRDLQGPTEASETKSGKTVLERMRALTFNVFGVGAILPHRREIWLKAFGIL